MTVILSACLARIRLGAKLGAVDGTNDQDLGALLDHRGDLDRLLGMTPTVGENWTVAVNPAAVEPIVEQLLCEHPVLRGLLRHRDTDNGVLGEAGRARSCRWRRGKSRPPPQPDGGPGRRRPQMQQRP